MRVALGSLAIVLTMACAPPPPRPHTARAEDQPSARAYREREAARRSKALEDRRARDDAFRERVQADAAARATARETRDRDQAEAHERACAEDRAARLERWQRARDERAANAAKHEAAVAWADKHCQRTIVGEYARRLCDGGSNVAKMCDVRVGEHEELRCPPGAPAGVTATGIIAGKTAAEQRAEIAADRDRNTNTRCADMPDAKPEGR